MQIGIVSDTHGHIPNTLAAVRMLQSLDVDVVLHCGDIGSPEIPPLFKPWPTHFVLGNVDLYECDELEQAILAAGHHFHNRFADLCLANRRIAVLHSDDTHRFQQTIASAAYDLICYGHTHIAEHHHAGPTLVLNPGALYRAKQHTVAVVGTNDLTVTRIIV
ncbi:MAG: metallophosphoesterase family protein [Planctomycetales bacterium]|nr:metallophosphoesterase family protein [Planctomycetales bacterium]MCA9224408.1 metallophosphoesterase family protein [Planctomycetales bacterium]